MLHPASGISWLSFFHAHKTQQTFFYFPPLKIAPMLRLTQPHLPLLLYPLVAVVALVVGRMWVAIFVVSLCHRRRRCLCLCWKERRIIGSFTRSPLQRLVQLTHRQREQEKGKEEEEKERKRRWVLRACVARWLRKWIRVLFSAFAFNFFALLHLVFCFAFHAIFPVVVLPVPRCQWCPSLLCTHRLACLPCLTV